MSNSETSPDNDTSKSQKRNLPSWMSGRDNANKSREKRPRDDSDEGDKQLKVSKGHAKEHTRESADKELEHGKISTASSSSTANFSRLLDGVVFVLSGFVNPERGTLRSQSIEMGAEFKPDWNSDCTLLICAFRNTPKYRQVESACGTIVSKEWISECYSQKKLVDIEQYLMSAGNPWRKSNNSSAATEAKKESAPGKSHKEVDKRSEFRPSASPSSKSRASDSAKEVFSSSEVKKWAIDDLNKTIAWLESQEEKPEPSEIKQVATEGVLTCLQDAIDALEKKQDVLSITEQWNFVPRVVEELAKVEHSENKLASFSKGDLCRQAKVCKRLYENELKKKDLKGEKSVKNMKNEASLRDTIGYESDETIEMTEEEVDLAYRNVASKYRK